MAITSCDQQLRKNPWETEGQSLEMDKAEVGGGRGATRSGGRSPVQASC
uniref:Alternative protein PRKAG3 n=1 Tax=Homo sapiens TaxID=9606 RepID=L8EAW7_HUMAN|nr:alternative protein PRKAG3 [Homo sapiens]